MRSGKSNPFAPSEKVSNSKNSNNNNNQQQQNFTNKEYNPQQSLWQRWKKVEPRKRIFLSFGLLVLTSSALYLKNLDYDLNPFSPNKTETVYKTIDYSKPADQRYTVTKNGVDITHEYYPNMKPKSNNDTNSDNNDQ
eukprot:gene4001-5003_t